MDISFAADDLHLMAEVIRKAEGLGKYVHIGEFGVNLIERAGKLVREQAETIEQMKEEIKKEKERYNALLENSKILDKALREYQRKYEQ